MKVKKGGLSYLALIAYRNIYRNIRRSILCFIAIAMAVFFIIFMMGFIEGMLDSMYKVVQLFETGDMVVYTKEYEPKKEFYPLQYPVEPEGTMEDLVADLESIEGVRAVLPRITSGATLMDSTVKHGVLWGIDIERELASNHMNLKDKTDGLLAGRYPKGNRSEAAVGFRLARKLGVLGRIYAPDEFDWLLENITSDEDRELVESVFKFDNVTGMYNFNNDIDKATYVKLFSAIIGAERTTVPMVVGVEGSGGLIDKINLTFHKEYILERYTPDGNGETMSLNRNLFEEELDEITYIFDRATTIRIPLKIISSKFSDKFLQPKVVGIVDYDFATIDKNFIIIPLAKMQRLANLVNQTQTMYIYLDNPSMDKEIAPLVQEKLGNDDLLVKTWSTSYWVTYFEMARSIYFIIYIVFITVASFLIVNTIIMVIHERMKEIGMMGALGMDRREIIGVFFLEAVFLSLIGAMFGGLFGGILTGVLSQMPISMEAMTGGIEFPTSNTIYVQFSFLNILQGMLYGLLVSGACTLLPSLKAAFIEPVEALRR
jgi:ABC-type lipoprotein release transport system permease subunit